MFKVSAKIPFAFVCVTLLGTSMGTIAQELEEAPPPVLKGTYEVSRVRSCIFVGNVAQGAGFGGNDGTLNLANGRTDTDVIRSTFIFNGDGTGTQINEALTVRHDATGAGQKAVRKSTNECSFDYTVFMDGSFVRFNHTCESTGKQAGFGDDNKRLVSGIETGGQLAKGNQSFVLSDVGVNVEEVINLGPDGELGGGDDTFSYRICNRSGFGVKK